MKPFEFSWPEIIGIYMGAGIETGKHAAAAWRLRDQIKKHTNVIYDAKSSGIAAKIEEEFPEVFILQLREKDKEAVRALVKSWILSQFTPARMDVYEFLCERMGAREEFEETVREMGLAESEQDAEPAEG